MKKIWQAKPAFKDDILLSLFAAALDAALPANTLPDCLPEPPEGRTVVIGAGKASAAMAQTLEQHWTGPLEGIVVTRYDHGCACGQIEIIEAAHPVPDEKGREAAGRIFELVSNLTADDLVIALISGGGSALLSLPADGLSLSEKQDINAALLKSGATISQMNCVRKHISKIKGGRLAQAVSPAKLHGLLISDIPGDDPSMIASGPTVPDATTLENAREILEKHKISLSENVLNHLNDASNETPKPGHAVFTNVVNAVIATPQASLDAAAEAARAFGLDAHILSDRIEGQAADAGLVHAAIAHQVASRDQPFKKPCVLLSGGETTVTVTGGGRGGRNSEFLLSLAIDLNGAAGISAIACDTDGIDGNGENAGARIMPDTLARASALGLNAQQFLDNNDAYTFFKTLGDLIHTGPTLTNVNDFRAILVSSN